MPAYLFAALVALFPAVVASQYPYTAIETNAESDLIPEGIAVSGRASTIYLSSMNKKKIIAVDMKGTTRDFISPHQDGYMEGLGMTIDTVRNWLWTLSIDKQDSLYFSRVHAFDLNTGKMMQQYILKDSSSHVLNDLVITESGYIYITDTYYGSVYRLDPKRRKLELFIKAPLTSYPNGLVSTGDQLIIATYVNGIVTLDLETKELKRLAGIKDTVMSHALDGLAIDGNTIYGVYNMSGDQKSNAVLQYRLNQARDSVVSERVLDMGNKHFNLPTTIAYSNGSLYLLANTYIGEFKKNSYSTKGLEKKLVSPVILAYKVGDKAEDE